MINMDPETGILENFIPVLTPMALKAVKGGQNPDIPTYQQVMSGPHRRQFEEAMIKEIHDLEVKGTWTGILCSTVPKGVQIIPLTWAF